MNLVRVQLHEMGQAQHLQLCNVQEPQLSRHREAMKYILFVVGLAGFTDG